MTSPTRILSHLGHHDARLLLRWSLPRNASPLARTGWIAITHLGSAATVIGAVAWPWYAGWIPAIGGRRAAVALTGSHLVVQFLKRVAHRQRPLEPGIIPCPDRFSFPSGHAASSLTAALNYAVIEPTLAPLLLPLGLMIGWSRVVLGVHYPGDVAAGQLIACISVALAQSLIS